MSNLTLEQLQAQLMALTAENERLKANKQSPGSMVAKLTPKVSAKGAVSIYGMGRFPVTLYKSQVIRMTELLSSEQFKQWLADNDGLLKQGKDE